MPPSSGPPQSPEHQLLLQRYERLLEVLRSITSTLELPALLRILINAAVELTDTEAASIMLFDPRTGQLRFEATTNQDPVRMEEIVVPLEGSIAGTIFTSLKPLVIADAASDPRHFRRVDTQTLFVTRSILGVPLVSKGKGIGVLQTLNKHGGASFTDADITILEALGTQAAVAIVNARLFQQSDLIAEMVHEIRTPLAALTATSHILARTDLPPLQRAEFVTAIQEETNRLATMTTEFLDLARLESGRARFERQPLNMAELVRECVTIVSSQAETRQVSIQAQTEAAPAVMADRSKIKQVLLNLLTNAIKYNRDGGRIVVTCQADGQSLHLDVQDTGKGIPADSLPRIFEKFYRVPDSEGWSQGTGLGLAIAKRIVESHGGRLSVESVVNEGTTFSLTLPLV